MSETVPNPEPQVETPIEELTFEQAFAQVESEGDTPNQIDGDTPSDPLSATEVKDLLSHEILGPKLKSHIDTEWANQSRGSRAQWEREYEQTRAPQIQRQVTEQLLGSWFEGMDPQELGPYLAEHPNLAAAYASYRANQEAAKNPPPAPPNNGMYDGILARIRANNQRLTEANLPDEVRATLDPNNYRDQGDAGLVKWTNDIDNAIVAHRVKTQTAEALEAQRTEDGAANDSQSGLFSNGSPTGVLGDLENDPPQLLLERALAIEAAAARKR